MQELKWIALILAMCVLPACGDDDSADKETDTEVATEDSVKTCHDDKDNDEDGDVDCADADCEEFCYDTEPEGNPDERRMLLRDEGNGVLHYIDLADESNNWHAEIPDGRDLQLVGDGRVMIGTEEGYQEYDIETGEMVDEMTGFNGTIAASRLRNGNTLLVGTNWQEKKGVVLVEIDPDGEVVRTINTTEYRYARIARQTPDGTFLVTVNVDIIELDDEGEIIWKATVQDSDKPHAWMAVRLHNGDTVVACGYRASLQVFDADGEYKANIQGEGSDIASHFYSGFQVMRSGNYVVANWQDHGAGNGDKGTQIIELDADGEVVWSWKQDPEYISSIQGVLVLDDLDLDKLHVEGKRGNLEPVE